MNCSKIKKLMLDYVYEELAPDKVLEFERHVKDCSECARALSEIQFTRSAMRNVEVKVPSGDVIEAVMREAERSVESDYSIPIRRERMRAAASWRPFLAGAACVMLMLGMIQMTLQPFTKTVPGPERIIERQMSAALPVSFDEATPAQTKRMPDYEIGILRKLIPQVDEAITNGDANKLRQLHNDYLGVIQSHTQLLCASLILEMSSAAGHDSDPDLIKAKLDNTLYLATNGYFFEAFTMLKIMQRDTDRASALYYLIPARLGYICEALGISERACEYYALALADQHIKPEHKTQIETRINGLTQTQATTN